MKILLYVFIAGVVIFFIVPFISGVVTAAISGRKSRTNKIAGHFLSRLSPEMVDYLVDIYVAWKGRDVGEINKIVSANFAMTITALSVLDPETRPPEMSAGEYMDDVSFSAWVNSLLKQGALIEAAKIVAGIYLYHLDGILHKEAVFKGKFR